MELGSSKDCAQQTFNIVKMEVSSFSLFQGDETACCLGKKDKSPGKGVVIDKIYWREEMTFCYQLMKGFKKISRRADTNFINGTKLMSACDITRGRRDGILRAEKIRYIVRDGPMDLQGVWIPFERARRLAIICGFYNTVESLFAYDLEFFYHTYCPSTHTCS